MTVKFPTTQNHNPIVLFRKEIVIATLFTFSFRYYFVLQIKINLLEKTSNLSPFGKEEIFEMSPTSDGDDIFVVADNVK